MLRSYVVLDPKGKTYEKTAGYRHRYQKIARYAPCRPDSACINPLDTVAVGTEDEVMDVEAIAGELVNSAALEETDSHIYLEVAELLITAAVLHVLHYAPPDKRHLPEVLHRLTKPGMNNQARLLAICEKPIKGAELVLDSARELAADKKICQGAFTTALGALKFCRIPSVARSISRSTFKPQDLSLGASPMTVYLEFPFRRAKVLRPLARLIMSTLLNHHTDERKFDTCYPLNELASLGNIELREYGVQFVFFFQSEGQLFMHYGKEAGQTIMDNCLYRATLGVVGQKAAESLRDRMGKATLVQERKTQAVSQKSLIETTVTNTRGEGANARELVTADEAKAQPSIYVTVEMPYSRPYLGKRAVAYSQPELLRRMKVPPPSPRHLRLVEDSNVA
jgi:type IV secretory pathway TraG/TraD family ATPase VirD4